MDVQLNGQSLTTSGSAGTTAPSAGTSETWTVAALGSGIPTLAGSQTYALVDASSGASAGQQAEIIRVTAAVAGATSITVTRGVEGTTPVAHAAASPFNIVEVAEPMNNPIVRAPAADWNGLLAWTGDPAAAVSSAAMVAATDYTCELKLFKGDIVSKFWYWVNTAATTPTDAYLVLYDPSGNIIAGSQTADQSSVLTSAGVKSPNLGTPYVATATGLYVATFRYATGTTLKFNTTTSGGQYNLGPGGPRFGVSSAAWTTAATPPSALGTIATSGSVPILAGLS